MQLHCVPEGACKQSFNKMQLHWDPIVQRTHIWTPTRCKRNDVLCERYFRTASTSLESTDCFSRSLHRVYVCARNRCISPSIGAYANASFPFRKLTRVLGDNCFYRHLVLTIILSSRELRFTWKDR